MIPAIQTGGCCRRCWLGLQMALFLALGVGRGRAEPLLVAKSDLTSFSLEQLMALEVTSVSRTPDKYFQAPAAIYVITGDDIRRSGVTTLAEALRLAPGMLVARIGASQWAVGARGFASGLSRYTLVLLDGRTVYTPLFAGTYWDAQDTLLEDVDRIEIIRGPGGALWGANAVNGVINVVTKKAKETPGALTAVGGGSEERVLTGVRYGGARGENFHYRIYGKYADRGNSFARKVGGFDAWQSGQGGVRADWEGDGTDFTLQSEAYRAREGQRRVIQLNALPPFRTAVTDGDASGGHLLARWAGGGRAPLSLQVYYDHTAREDPNVAQEVDTAEADFQQSFPPFWRQKVTYGASYRRIWDETRGLPTFFFVPRARVQELWGLFFQDQISLAPDRLVLTLGVKSERNVYTRWENQPGARIAWTPSDRHTLWSAVSRAVRTPSRLDREPSITFISSPTGLPSPFPPVLAARYVPNPNFDSEKLVAYESGYRVRPVESLFAGVEGFFNRYDDAQSLNFGPTFIDGAGASRRFVIPFFFENNIRGRIYGGECNAVWRPAAWGKIEGVYSYLRINLENKRGAKDGVSARDKEGLVPRHQAVLRASVDLPGRVEIDPTARYVAALPGPRVPAYWTMDFRVAWFPLDGLEVSAVGQNLLQRRHAESGESVTEVQRGVYGKVTWRWRP